jgi:hypothetical protein
MGIRFGMWDVKCLYKADLIMTDAKEISKYELDYRRPDGTKVALNQQVSIHFSMVRGITILN